MESNKLKLIIEVPFSSEREVETVYEVLRVDKEPPRSQTSKLLSYERNILRICFSAPNFHQLRKGVNGLLDNLLLVCETLMNFGPPVSPQYTCYN